MAIPVVIPFVILIEVVLRKVEMMLENRLLQSDWN